MKRILGLALLLQGSIIMAQKTVVTQYGERVTIHPNIENGLTGADGNTQLGGTLIKPTTIETSSTNTLSLTNLQAGGAAGDKIMVTDAAGVLKSVIAAGANMMLSTDSSGKMVWTAKPTASTYTANNGLTLTGNNFQLGGTLVTGGATIATAGNPFYVTGLTNSAVNTDKLLVSMASGALKNLAGGTDSFLTTDTNGVMSWQSKSSALGNDAWLLGGNTVTTAAQQRLGTNNSANLYFKTNNKDQMILNVDGLFGLGDFIPTGRSPFSKIHILTDNNVAFNQNDIYIESYNGPMTNNNDPIVLTMQNNRGTYAAPLNLKNGDVIGELSFRSRMGGINTPMASLGYQYSGNGTTIRGNIYLSVYGAARATLDQDGLFSVTGSVKANGVTLTSDVRYKKDIKTIVKGLDIVNRLRGATYKYDIAKFPDKGFSEGKQYGVIAQEVEKVTPELVTTGEDGYKSVNYQGMIPILIEAVKEQQKQIEIQQKQIDELKALVAKR